MKDTLYFFKYLGLHEGRHVIRAPTWDTEHRGPVALLYFQNQVFDWLFENTKGWYHLANCNVDGMPNVPALANAKSICVLFELRTDLENFSKDFPVRDV